MVLNLSHQIGVVWGSTLTGNFAQEAQPYPAVTAIRHPSAINKLRLSLIHGGVRPKLSIAMFDVAQGKEYVIGGIGRNEEKKGNGIPVYVMIPLDNVICNHKLNRWKAMKFSLMALKCAGVEGIMIDVWWGLVEDKNPREYDWGGYSELLGMANKLGLKVIATMSFHQCGAGDIGDSRTIPLPNWVVEEINNDPELAYTDEYGRRNYGYISFGCDSLPVLKGRTPVQCYSDFMKSFRDKFDHLLGNTLTEIQVGMGPTGELRYPFHIPQNGTSKSPGNGAFQCNNKYMVASLKAAAESIGKPEWGLTNSGINTSDEFREFFHFWYSQMLLNHGEMIIRSAKSAFKNTLVNLSVKIEDVHCHFGSISHITELKAAYLPIAKMLGRHGAVFNMTCLEMRNCKISQDAICKPGRLVRQVALATELDGVQLRIYGVRDRGMTAFAYLMMTRGMFDPDNWRRFAMFVKGMRQGKDASCGEEQLEHGPFCSSCCLMN